MKHPGDWGGFSELRSSLREDTDTIMGWLSKSGVPRAKLMEGRPQVASSMAMGRSYHPQTEFPLSLSKISVLVLKPSSGFGQAPPKLPKTPPLLKVNWLGFLITAAKCFHSNTQGSI